jgi:anti-anti-sigma factor
VLDPNVMKLEFGSTGRLRIELDGEFWGAHALSLAERLPLAELAGAKSVVLSLEKIRHMDQAGVAMLVRLYSHLRIRGCHLRLVDVPAAAHQLLERVGLATLVCLAESLDREPAHHTIALGARAEV